MSLRCERNLQPQNKDWFAYKMSEPEATSVVAQTMSELTGLDWDPLDVNMTNGGFAAIAVSLRTLLEPGDEAIFLSPPWFFYEQLIARERRDAGSRQARDARLRASIRPRSSRAITPRTRVVILNSPHNPSGRVVSLDELRALAEMLDAASRGDRPSDLHRQ